MHDLTARIVKIIGTRYPRLRSMIRNHPYTKIVGFAILRRLEEAGHRAEDVTDTLLEKLVDEGIALYHRYEKDLEAIDVVEQKRRLLAQRLKESDQLPALVPSTAE